MKVRFNIKIGSVDLGESMLPRFENVEATVETEASVEEIEAKGDLTLKILPAIKEVIEQARLGL